jgi:hypothetical protein
MGSAGVCLDIAQVQGTSILVKTFYLREAS